MLPMMVIGLIERVAVPLLGHVVEQIDPAHPASSVINAFLSDIAAILAADKK